MRVDAANEKMKKIFPQLFLEERGVEYEQAHFAKKLNQKVKTPKPYFTIFYYFTNPSNLTQVLSVDLTREWIEYSAKKLSSDDSRVCAINLAQVSPNPILFLVVTT
jgi:hypothetical protein